MDKNTFQVLELKHKTLQSNEGFHFPLGFEPWTHQPDHWATSVYLIIVKLGGEEGGHGLDDGAHREGAVTEHLEVPENTIKLIRFMY